MTAKAPTLIAYEALLSVLVLKNPAPAHDDDAVHAVCLEQDLVGRGHNVQAAIQDLSTTIVESITHEFSQSEAEYANDADPALLAAFESRVTEVDDMPVLRRGRLLVRISGATLKPSEIAFQPLKASA